MLVCAGLLFGHLGVEFTPKLDKGSITTMGYKPVCLSLPKSLTMEEATERAMIKRFPAITHVFARIGTSKVATDPRSPNENDLYIFYKPEKDWPKGDGQPGNKLKLIKGIQKKLNATVLGPTFKFAQPIETQFNEMLEGTRSDVSVGIFGNDYDQLEKLTAQVANLSRERPVQARDNPRATDQ